MEIAFKSFEEKIIHRTLKNIENKIYLLDHLMSKNQNYTTILKNLSVILKQLIMYLFFPYTNLYIIKNENTQFKRFANFTKYK
jgi:hypothetical protein